MYIIIYLSVTSYGQIAVRSSCTNFNTQNQYTKGFLFIQIFDKAWFTISRLIFAVRWVKGDLIEVLVCISGY